MIYRTTKKWSPSGLLIGLMVSTGCAGTTSMTTPTPSTTAASSQPQSQPKVAAQLPGPFQYASVLTFAPEGTLFVADSGTGKIYSIVPPAIQNPAAQAPYNLRNIDDNIAALLGTTSKHLRIRDMAVHPKTKEVYLAVGRVTGETYASTIVVVNQTGVPRLLDLSGPMKKVQVPFSPASGFKFYDEVPARDLSITDLEYHDGRLYVAGLSNADFASSLWTVPIPFDGSIATTTVEIYHAVHNQQETRAPIRTMKIVKLNGQDHLVAAYTCTPLVVIPLTAVKDGAHVVGKTIAELGYGNTPGDLVTFTGQDAKQKPFDVLFLSNKNQSAQIMAMKAIEAAAAKDGMTKPVMLTKAGVDAIDAPMTGVMRIADQDPYHLVAVRRDVDNGDVELVSYLKNVYFRLSDFQSEYEIPGYTYPAEQAMIREFQNKMKRDEGKEAFVVE